MSDFDKEEYRQKIRERIRGTFFEGDSYLIRIPVASEESGENLASQFTPPPVVRQTEVGMDISQPFYIEAQAEGDELVFMLNAVKVFAGDSVPVTVINDVAGDVYAEGPVGKVYDEVERDSR